jgi:ElaB/YqjD/DUF883 family membrane-anchored ribosome-binding protein
MNEITAANKDKLMSDLRLVISDAEELLHLTVDQVGESAVGIRNRVQDRLDQAKVDLLQLQQAAVTKVKAVGHAADDFVQDNPWKAIGIAAGIGLVLGLLVSRR